MLAKEDIETQKNQQKLLDAMKKSRKINGWKAAYVDTTVVIFRSVYEQV